MRLFRFLSRLPKLLAEPDWRVRHHFSEASLDEENVVKDLKQRISNADPSRTWLFRIIEVSIKLIQWTITAGLVRVAADKTSDRTLNLMSYVIQALIVCAVVWVVFNALNSVYAPRKFAWKSDRVWGYIFLANYLIGISIYLVFKVFAATRAVAIYYLNK